LDMAASLNSFGDSRECERIWGKRLAWCSHPMLLKREKDLPLRPRSDSSDYTNLPLGALLAADKEHPGYYVVVRKDQPSW
jgi:hypothetical protein